MPKFVQEYLNLPWKSTQCEEDDGGLIDDLYLREHSFTYRILHGTVQNVFSSDSDSENENKNGHMKNKGFERRGRYIPCFVDEGKIKYPKPSTLNKDQQALYLQLMMKYGKHRSLFLTPAELKEFQKYELLQEKVAKERYEFIQFVKQKCAMSQERYLLISPDIKRYVEELWTFRLADVSKYPPGYEALRILPLVYSDNRRPIIMKLEENLLDIGSVPYVIMPKFKKMVTIHTDYSRTVMRCPPDGTEPFCEGRSRHKVQVSEDKNAEKLATYSGADIVISASALKSIADNHSPSFEKSWDIPVVVKECKDTGTGRVKRVAFIDKKLPPRVMTTVEKNLRFYRTVTKTFICHKKHPSSLQLGDAPIEASCSVIPEGESNAKSNSESESWETEDSDSEEKPAMNIFDPADLHESSLAEPQSPGNSCEGKLDFFQSDDCEESDLTDSDCKLVIDCSDSDRSPQKNLKTLNKKRSSAHQCFNKQEFENSGIDNRITRSKARLIQKMSSINLSLGQKPVKIIKNSTTDVENKFSENDNIVLEGPNKNSKSKQKCDRKCFPQQKAVKMKDISDIRRWILPPPYSNVSYKLWKLKKNECQNDDNIKGGFLKGDTTNHEIKVLVRCKMDGYQIKDGTKQTLHVVPKLEYQSEFGAECLTHSELVDQWISLFLRPGASICRVRINACTSEVMMIEERTLQEVSQESIYHLNRPVSSVLGTLYNILLGVLDLEPGNYLLSHTPKLGAFVNLRKNEMNGRYNLHDMYNVDPKAVPQNDTFVWNPIDHSIVTPFHRAYERVPGTFPAIVVVKGKTVVHRRTGKKRNSKRKTRRKPKRK